MMLACAWTCLLLSLLQLHFVNMISFLDKELDDIL